MKTKTVKFFLYSSAVMLLVTGIAKLAAASGSARLLQYTDSILQISFRDLFVIVGLIEVVVALVILFYKNILIKTLLISWLATDFLFYRIGLVWTGGWKKTCPCLGTLTDALHVSPQTADGIMKYLVAYLLIGSYVSLFWLWRQKRILMKQQFATQNQGKPSF